ncbi:Ribonuclease P complex subunit Pop1 [Trichuris trichiura]|uniref:Ribonuclease P complex subunit Pop1 n=1 Tax=Trichuris trichiura TaxID=36087 RepID=A0A077Z241_TRITR|nr:Ribonuclease P complex subunit Pop1 [Trichuris trichiura]
MNNILFLLMLSIHFVRADVDSDDFEAVDRFKRYYYYPLRYGYYPIVSSGLPSINGKLKRLRPKRYYPYYYGHGWWPGYYSSWYSPWYGDSWGWWWW